MADKDFRIDLILGAKFAEGFRAIDEAKRKLESAERSASKFSRTGVTLGAALRTAGYAGIAAASAATVVMGLYIQKTIEAEKVQAQLAARIKDTGGVAGRTLEDLNKQSKALSHVTVFDDEAIGQAQAMLLTFTQIRGVNFDNTVEATLNLATAMGTDATDAAKTLGKALSDPAKGMDQLKRAGVTFTDAQRDVIQKMVETGHIAEAQGMLLDALKSKMGSAATAARNTLGGAIDALKNSFDDLLEGDTGDAGIKGTRNAIESLIKTLNDPATRQGTQALIADLFAIANAAITAAAKVGNLITAIRENYFSDTADQSTTLLQNRKTDLETQLFRAQRRSGGGLSDAPDPIGKLLGYGQGKDGEIADIKRQLAEIDAEITKRNKAAGQAAFDAAHPLVDHGGKGQFINVNGVNVVPEGEGVSTAKPPKTGGGSKSDADADIKNRIANLKEETALLGQVKEGEDKASEAAKARYDITEGEFKNKSPQLKAEYLAAAEALDQKNAAIEAEKKRKEAIEDSKEAYDDLLKELRTPAEIALDDAIAKVHTLDEAMKLGIGTKADYDKALGRVAGSLVEQSNDPSLAPQSPFADLDQRVKEENARYQESLANLRSFNAQTASEIAAANKAAEDNERIHAQVMRNIEADRQNAMLSMASGVLGQIAQLQNSQNAKAARIGKAAAIAQAIINTYQSATEAYKAMAGIPYVGPALAVAAAAAAIAAGLANVAAIRAQPIGGGGYAEGGYTGAGGKYQPAGIVHAGEGVLNQSEIAALGGPAGFYALREWIDEGHARAILQGYADGGLAGASMPALTPPDWGSFPQGNIAFKGGENRLSLYNLFDVDSLAQKIANHPAMEDRMVVVAGDNGTAIRAKWGSR